MIDIFIMTDQPPSCDKCWARAEILAEFIMDELGTQLCRCNNINCGYIFLEQEDDYFSIDYWCSESRD